MRRWTGWVLALGVPGVLGPYLLFVQADSEAATPDADAYYELVSVRSDKVLDVPGADTSDGAWTRQQSRVAGAASQQWRLRPTGDGYYALENRGSKKVLGVRDASRRSRRPPSSSSPTTVPPPSSGRSRTSAARR